MSFSACYPQSLALGVAGGIRTTNDLLYGVSSESKRYAVGPTIRIDLASGFGVAIEALYRHQGYEDSARLTGPLGLGSEIRRVRVNSWEFPILGMYRISSRRVKPFVEAGYAPRVMHGSYAVVNAPSSSATSVDWLPVTHGLVAGGGVQYEIGRLVLLPALRYTHWNNAAPSGFSAQNQLDLLVRITWKVR